MLRMLSSAHQLAVHLNATLHDRDVMVCECAYSMVYNRFISKYPGRAFSAFSNASLDVSAA